MGKAQEGNPFSLTLMSRLQNVVVEGHQQPTKLGRPR